jgi:hypothetical protein
MTMGYVWHEFEGTWLDHDRPRRKDGLQKSVRFVIDVRDRSPLFHECVDLR